MKFEKLTVLVFFTTIHLCSLRADDNLFGISIPPKVAEYFSLIKREYTFQQEDSSFGMACRESLGETETVTQEWDRDAFKSYLSSIIARSAESDVSAEIGYFEKLLPNIDQIIPEGNDYPKNNLELPIFPEEADSSTRQRVSDGFFALLEIMDNNGGSGGDILEGLDIGDQQTSIKIGGYKAIRLRNKLTQIKCEGIINGLENLFENRYERDYLNYLLGDHNKEFLDRTYSSYGPGVPVTPTTAIKINEYIDTFKQIFIDGAEYKQLKAREHDILGAGKKVPFAIEHSLDPYNECHDEMKYFLDSFSPASKNQELEERLSIFPPEELPKELSTEDSSPLTVARKRRKDLCSSGSNIDRTRLPPVQNQMRFGHCTFYTAHAMLTYESGTEPSIPQMVLQNAQSVLTGDSFTFSIRDLTGPLTGDVNRSIFQMGAKTPEVLERYISTDKQCSMEDLPVLTSGQNLNVCVIANYVSWLNSTSNIVSPEQVRTALEFLICKSSGSHLKSLRDLGDQMIPFLEMLNSSGRPEDGISNVLNKCPASTSDLQKSSNLCVIEGSKYGDSNNIMETIDQAFDEGKPIGIAVDAGMFNETTMIDGDYSGNHAVTLIDRRWNETEGTCQYLIRNSWGDDWGVTDGVMGIQNETQTPNGNVWIDESVLYSNSGTVSYLSNKRCE